MMDFWRNFFIKTVYIIIDLCCLLAAVGLACVIRQETIPFPPIFSEIFATTNPFRIVFFVFILTALFLNRSYHLYETRREIGESMEVWNIVRSVIVASLLAMVTIFTFKIQHFPRTILFLVVAFSGLFFSVWQIFKRLFVGYLVAKGYNNFNAVISGAGRV